LVLQSVAATSPPKIIYKLPEVTGSEIEGHSFLRLVTPSGTIYHFKDDATLVVERKDKEQNDSKNLPFITYGPPYGTKYYIHFPADQAGFKLFEGIDKSGRDPIVGDLQIRTFAGPNRKRYSMAYFNYPLIQEIRRVEDDIVNYLQLVFEYNSQVYAFTFSENGDELTRKDNCTDSTFLTLAFPNGKVHKIKQSSQSRDEEETVADISSLPYITFFHVDGAKYDINFPQNGSDAQPSIARDKWRDRERCAGSVLDRFIGPNGKEYSFEVKNYQPTISAVSPEQTLDKVNIHVYNPTGQSVYYEYTADGELIGLKMTSSAIGVEQRPATPFNVTNVEFNCIQNCE